MTRYLLLILLLVPSLSFASTNLPFADSVLVEKSKRKMYLISNGKKYREYDISLGDNPVGHKLQRGDEKTPEGTYTIDYRNPQSSYHLSLHITYPNQQDKSNAYARGVHPGSNIFIHGLPNDLAISPAVLQGMDWTDGCIAVSNSEIQEIWALVKNGRTIEIRP